MQFQYLNPDMRSAESSQKVMKEMEEICVKMMTDIAGIWSQKKKLSTPDEMALNYCYLVFQDTFSRYMAFFPGSQDLRFAPLSDVHRGTLFHTQTMDFLRH
jgi:hypothetical protein